MSASSRQEAMEGEPVRRHVSDAVLKYNKPVYGLFIAIRIDTNTAETFRHGVWYAKGDKKQRLDIIPLTLAQFQKYFAAMFQTKQAAPYPASSSRASTRKLTGRKPSLQESMADLGSFIQPL